MSAVQPGWYPVESHHVRVDYDKGRWACACGDAGAGKGEQTAGDVAQAHAVYESAQIVPRLVPEQLGALLLAGADDSAQVAAVELVVAHGHWLGYGGLRSYIELDWNPDGDCR